MKRACDGKHRRVYGENALGQLVSTENTTVNATTVTFIAS
jgi:hypothetical protein